MQGRKFKGFFDRDRKNLYMILGIMLFSVFTLTVVYAALSATLNITGSTEISSSSWDIYLANVEVKNGSVEAESPQITGSDLLSFNVNLTLPGDFYEFTVDVVNDGSIDAMIDSVCFVETTSGLSFNNSSTASFYGVRPVITISRSLF